MSDKRDSSTDLREERRREDHEIVRACIRGDEAALEVLSDRLACVPRILAVLNAKMGRPLSESDLADVGQEVLMLLWSKLSTYEARARLETWANRFCFLELMNHVRRKGRDPMISGQKLDQVMEWATARSEGPSLYEVELLGQGLEELGPPESDIVRLKHFEELTFKEIGGALGISPNTVKTQYYRGIGWLRQWLSRRQKEERT